jgi:hypothetical protein
LEGNVEGLQVLPQSLLICIGDENLTPAFHYYSLQQVLQAIAIEFFKKIIQ